MNRGDDERWMREALALAARGEGYTAPNPPVGAVVVRRGRCVGAGYHHRAGGPHAEVLALNEAGRRARGATLYVTLEPCCTFGRTPPCTDRIVADGVGRVVVGARDPNPRHRGHGLRRLRNAGIAVTAPVLRHETERLIAPFAKWVTTGTPYVVSKAGMTLDGRIADAEGRSQWITSPAARRMGQALRRQSDAILVGARTAMLDDPRLTVRRRKQQPYRVVVDARGRVAPTARLFCDEHADRTILAVTKTCPAARVRLYEAHGTTVWRLPGRGGRVALDALFQRLGELGVLRVLCEGGGTLTASLLEEGWVDEAVWFVAPAILGGGSVPVVGGRGRALTDCYRFTIDACERVGPDLMIRARPRRGERTASCSRD